MQTVDFHYGTNNLSFTFFFTIVSLLVLSTPVNAQLFEPYENEIITLFSYFEEEKGRDLKQDFYSKFYETKSVANEYGFYRHTGYLTKIKIIEVGFGGDKVISGFELKISNKHRNIFKNINVNNKQELLDAIVKNNWLEDVVYSPKPERIQGYWPNTKYLMSIRLYDDYYAIELSAGSYVAFLYNTDKNKYGLFSENKAKVKQKGTIADLKLKPKENSQPKDKHIAENPQSAKLEKASTHRAKNSSTELKHYYFNENWQPASENAYRYKYTGKATNAKINERKAQIYDRQKQQFYFLTLDNSKPRLDQSVKIVKAIGGKNLNLKDVLPKYKSPFYLGKVDSNWNPKGEGTRYYESIRTKDGKKYIKWRIKTDWLNESEAKPNSFAMFYEEESKMYWQGDATKIKLTEKDAKIEGKFKVSNHYLYKDYVQGKFITGYAAYDKAALPIPVGTHVRYKVEDGVRKFMRSLEYSNGMVKDLRERKRDFYSYALLKNYQSQYIKSLIAKSNKGRNNNDPKNDRHYSSKTCPVCGGSGKEYVSRTYTDTESTYSEDYKAYYKTTKQVQKEHVDVLKCYRCKGTGKVEK